MYMKVLMPQLGETVTEGKIAAWHKQVGESVVQDEILLDIETDKVTTEIPAPANGILAEICVSVDEVVPVGTILASIKSGSDSENIQSDTDKKSNMPTASEISSPDEDDSDNENENEPIQLSPAVRRLILEHKIDINDLTGSGHSGRIKRQDVLQYIEEQSGSKGSVIEKTDDGQSGSSIIPFSPLRKKIAEHMVRSKLTSPHVLQAVEVDFHKVQQMRKNISDSWKKENGFSLTYLPFIARAVCLAIQEFPQINAKINDDNLVLQSSINLAIAVDLNFQGLLAPVVKSAGNMKFEILAKQMDKLIKRARDNSLVPDDMAGGTYTISNSGSFGTLITAPVINQPQVAILSVDGVRKRPVVVESENGDMLAIHPVGVLAQSFDHRAFDGAYSAAYLQRLREIIENYDWQSEFDQSL